MEEATTLINQLSPDLLDRFRTITELVGVPDNIEKKGSEIMIKWDSQPGTYNWMTMYIHNNEADVVSHFCDIDMIGYCYKFATVDDALVVASKMLYVRQKNKHIVSLTKDGPCHYIPHKHCV